MYAKGTAVSVAKSKAEIERILARYKADQFGIMVDNATQRAAIQFRIQKWIVRFELQLPSSREEDRAVMQRWRALVLTVKAKLESIESKIESFEEAFMPHVVLPDGQTLGRHMLPKLKQIRESGRMPQTLLPDYSGSPGGSTPASD